MNNLFCLLEDLVGGVRLMRIIMITQARAASTIVVAERKQSRLMERGVIYLGHIPHGFFERQMKAYFSQFGTVTRLKLARSRKVRCVSAT